MNPLTHPLVKFSEFDSNSDGQKDMFWFQISFKMAPSKVRAINLLSVFDYSLD